MDGFKSQTILSDDKIGLDVTDVFCGNGKVYLSIDFQNLTSETLKLSSLYISTPTGIVSGEPQIYSENFTARDSHLETICFDLGELALNCVKENSLLSLSFDYYVGEDLAVA